LQYAHRYAQRRKISLINHFVPKCRTLIDLGCGNGCYMNSLSKKADTVVGIDISISMCKMVRDKGYSVIRADANWLPLKDESIDVIYSSELIEHLPSLGVFDEMERVSQIIVATMPNPWNYFSKDPTHILNYSVQSLKRYLKNRERWNYAVCGLPPHILPLPIFLFFSLPWLSPSIAIIGRRKKIR